MSTKLISIIIGVILVLTTGTIVYTNKKLPYIPPATQTDKISTTTTSSITIAQVEEHNSRLSCWSAINGSVYDLTSWIPNHPGGEKAILSLCGIDGSSRYNGKHGGSQKTATILGGFKLGPLVN